MRYHPQPALLQLAIGLAGSLLATICFSAQPANDRCTGAILLQPGVPLTISTTNATDAGDPMPTCGIAFAGGVWFRFTPASNGLVRVSTCGSAFDTVLQVYTGTCNSLASVTGACNDDEGPACPDLQASVQFLGSGGVTYWILAGGASQPEGTLQIVANLMAPLSNDQCGGATPLQAGAPYVMSTANATDTGDPVPMCASLSGGVWFSFTPASNGIVQVSSCGSDFDTALQVYTGDCANPTPLAGSCNDDNGLACEGLQASMQFLGTGGVTYWILVGSSDGARGALRIEVTLSPALANDQCPGAVVLQSGVPVTMDTVTAIDVDPTPACTTSFGGALWFRFTPASYGVVRVSTCGSDFDTVLQVYRGDCNALTPVPGGCNDFGGPACAGFQASVQFLGSAGTTYWIMAGGYGGARGRLNILAELLPSLINDQCSGAITLQPELPVVINTTNATETGDPMPVCAAGFGSGVWFRFTPPTDGIVKIGTCDSDFDTVLQVYSGGCDAFVPLAGACNDNDGPACAGSQSSAQFLGSAGVTYWILAGGSHGRRGTLKMMASLTPTLLNDQCSGAIALQRGVPVTISTTNATQTGDPTPTCAIRIDAGVWFSFTPVDDGVIRVSTCGSDFDTILQVLTGTCGSLTPIIGGCNDDAGPACGGFQASVQFFGIAGVTYWIVAGDFTGTGGTLSIVADVIDRPPNDDCIGAVTLQPGVPFAMSTTNATATGDSMPTCQTNFGSGVWFKFTPQTSGTATISTCGSDFNTVLQVYSGSCGAPIPLASGCNDSGGQACPSANSAVVQFPGIAGQTYWVLAGGAFGARGSLRIVADPLPPVNDACNGAITLQPNVPSTIDTFLAGNASDLYPMCQTNFGHGIWFALTPGSNGMVTVSTCGTDFDTVLQVYTGDCNALTPVTGGCNDDNGPFCGGSRASVRFQGTAGVTYRILVGGYGGARGVVNIVADYPALSGSINITPGAESDLMLRINGVPGSTCVLQTSTNLLDWLDLAQIPIEANGRFDFNHTNDLNSGRFFRLRSP